MLPRAPRPGITTLWLAAGLALLPLAASSKAAAQDMESREGIALQNQILELRAQIDALRNQAPSGAAAPAQAAPAPGGDAAANDVTAQLVVRVGNLEEQNRQLQGRVEDLTNQLQRTRDDLTKQIGDLNFKLNPNGTPPAAGDGAASGAGAGVGAAAGAAVAGGAVAAGAAAAADDAPAAKRTPEMAIRAGNAALARRDYPAASAAAIEALQNGAGPRTTDAQMLLARAKYGQKAYKDAAAAYFSAYKRAPKGPEAPVALLGVANSLIGLNKPKDACSALARLAVEYPHAPEGVKTNAKAARKKAGCT